ncbi:MAG: 6-pyruvoyl tetrahydropterin synthase family protein [Thermoplasmatales archaeon]|nr:6-pyruvoyl tetrahydropterin synthase family protein [Thermoplasmatales archaeon]
MYLTIDGWKSNFTFSACHMIPAHKKCSRLHGHTYALHARIHGQQDKSGMIVDFAVVKDAMRKIVDELDHKVLLPKKKVKSEKNEVTITEKGRRYVFPETDVALIDIPSLTAENLAKYVLEKICGKIKNKNISEIEIGLDEGWGQGAWVSKRL